MIDQVALLGSTPSCHLREGVQVQGFRKAWSLRYTFQHPRRINARPTLSAVLGFARLAAARGATYAQPFARLTRPIVCVLLAMLLSPVLEAARPRRTGTPSVSAKARGHLEHQQQQAPSAVQSAEATPVQPTPAQATAPEAASSPSDPSIFFALAGATAALVGVVVLVRKQIRKSRVERERLAAENEAERQAALKEFESLSKWTDRQNWPNLNQEVSGVILAESETCVALSQGVQHMQLRKRTHYEGRTAGVSVRVMKGVSIRSGGFAGRPVTTVSEEVGDIGTVFVTDRRVLFAGGREVVEVPLRKLADARAEVGKLELLVANKPNPLEFQFSEAYRAPVIAGIVKLMVGVAQAGRGKA